MADQLQSLAFTLYGAAMVRSGIKTLVGIAIDPQPIDGYIFTINPDNPDDLAGAYVIDKARPAVADQAGRPPANGSLLWMAEPFFLPAMFDNFKPADIAARTERGGAALSEIPVGFEVDQSVKNWPAHLTVGRYRPASQMPHWASRSTCVVENARQTRLHDMQDDDAVALGVERYKKWKNRGNRRAYDVRFRYACQGGKPANAATIHAAYFKAWDRRHKAPELQASQNPFVTFIAFRNVALTISQLDASVAEILQSDAA